MWKWVAIATLLPATLLVALALGWPAAALLGNAWASSEGESIATTTRGLRLLLRGVCISGAAGVGAQILALGLTIGLVSDGRWQRALTRWVGALTLLTPPYLVAYATSLPVWPEGVPVGKPGVEHLPTFVSRELRAALCLSLWLAPVAAMILAGAWLKTGRNVFRLAQLDAMGLRAWIGAALPVLWPAMLATFIACFLLAFTEYTICHLCQAYTWNTEVLAELQALKQPALTLAWPLLAVLAPAIVFLWCLRRPLSSALAAITDASMLDESVAVGRRAVMQRVLWAGAVLALLSPTLLLLAYFHGLSAVVRVWSTYAGELWFVPWIGAGTAFGCALLMFGSSFLLGCRNVLARSAAYALVGGFTVAALLPPALVGEAFALAYATVPALRDSWLIISLCGLARFAAIALLATFWIAGRGDGGRLAMARVDGADWPTAFFRVALPGQARQATIVLACVAMLSVTEVGAVQLIAPPGVGSLARTLLNEIHFGRNDEVIALLLSVQAAAALVAVASTSLVRKSAPHS